MSETVKQKNNREKQKKTEKEHLNMKTVILHNVSVTLLIMGISTVMAQAFFHFSRNSTSVAIIYVLAVMLVARYTTGYITGIITSLFGVFFVNYVFTYPYMNFNFSLDGYPVTFIGMMLVSSITSTTTTRFKKQSRLLNQREKMLVEAEKETMRANLLRAVSHDLRTPLTSIIGLADTALSDSPKLTEEKRRELLAGIREDANWLLNMVENLLSVTRIKDSESAKVNKSPEIVEEVISEAIQRFKKRRPEASVRVSIPEDYIILPMDPLLIEQVIINLLDNACVHSSSSQPIDLTVIDSPTSVVFCIRDYGKGISPSLLPVIFDGSSARNTATPDAHRGMGIGLSICKTIITAHAGSITALNHDKGAEFMFTLPKEDSLS